MSCIFCNPEADIIIARNDYCYARFDKYPVNEGHLLIVPFRHYADYFESNDNERKSLFDLVEICKRYLDKKYKPDGFNIGINIGETAGQTIFHLHIHLIPRYKGDMPEPKGGVRGVIPDRQKY